VDGVRQQGSVNVGDVGAQVRATGEVPSDIADISIIQQHVPVHSKKSKKMFGVFEPSRGVRYKQYVSACVHACHPGARALLS
jgi:hypothetical protein